MVNFKFRPGKEDTKLHRDFERYARKVDAHLRKTEKNLNWASSSPTPEGHLFGMKKIGFPISFEEYEEDPELEKLLEGKRIAFVGPAQSLRGRNEGELIDSYDIIVRSNQHYEIPLDEQGDWGSRTDIVVTCFNAPSFKELAQNPEYFKQVQYFISGNLLLWNRRFVEEAAKLLERPFHIVSDGYFLKECKNVGTICNTGFMGILTLLHYPIKELYITGVDFYNFGKTKNNKKEVYSDSYIKSTDKLHGPLRLDIHNQERHIEYFKTVLEQNKNIKLDSVLENYYG